MKLLRFLVLISTFMSVAHFAHANPLHLYLQDKDVDVSRFRAIVAGLEDMAKWLNELDENGDTVLGAAIRHGHQRIAELLLRSGFSGLGPGYRNMTLAQFAFRVHQIPSHVFLSYYEHDILNGFQVEDAVARALVQQREFNWRQAQIREMIPPLPPAERLLGPGGYLAHLYPVGMKNG